MDINLIRSIVTVAAFIAFLGIVWWAYAPGQRARMEEAGRSVLEEQDQ